MPGPKARSARPGYFRARGLDDIRAMHDRETDAARRAVFRDRARRQCAQAGLTPPAWALESRRLAGA